MNYIFHRIFFNRDFFFPLFLFFDRLLFFVFYDRYYRKKFWFYGENIRWGRDAKWKLIPSTVRISNPDKIQLFDNCVIDDGVYLQAHHCSDGLIIGSNTRINANSHLQAYSKLIISANVLIAPYCHINSGNHGFDDKNMPIMYQEYRRSGEINIGEGVWLGRGSTVLGGVNLGRNTIVAASAVVTKTFPNNSILGGIPARIIKKR